MSDGPDESPESEAEGPSCTLCVEPTVKLNGLKINRDVSDGNPILFPLSFRFLLTALDWLLTNTTSLVVSRVVSLVGFTSLAAGLRHLITRQSYEGCKDAA